LPIPVDLAIGTCNSLHYRTSREDRLTQEFRKWLGCYPRFSTPNHPSAYGLVERLVDTIKSAISKIASEHPKQWHTHFWALRESSNLTTGVCLAYLLLDVYQEVLWQFFRTLGLDMRNYRFKLALNSSVPASNQLRTSFEPARVIEFGFLQFVTQSQTPLR